MTASVTPHFRHWVAGAVAFVGAATALAGPTEDALKFGEDALAKGDRVSASTTWVNAFNERATANTANDETCAKLLWNAGTLFAETGNPQAAAGCFDKLYPLRVNLSGLKDPESGKVGSRFAAALVNSGGDLDRAERLAREAVDILSQAGDEQRKEAFIAMSNLGGVLLAKKDRIAANEQYIRCLKFAEEPKKPAIPGELTAGCYDGLAAIASFFGRAADSQRYLQRSLELKSKALGKHDIRTLLARMEFAATQTSESAINEYQRVLADLYEAPNSETNTELQKVWASAEYKLAVLESQQGNLDRVISLLQSAIKHGTRGFGELHGELLQLNLDLAKVFLTRKEFEKGIACYRQVLAIRKKHLGPEHESTKETQKILDDLLADVAKLKR